MSRSEAIRLCADHTTVPLWPHAGRAIGLSRDKTYSAANKGEIEGLIEVGRTRRVTTAWLSRVLGLEHTAEAAD